MSVALTSVSLLYGFLPLKQIVDNLKSRSALTAALPKDLWDKALNSAGRENVSLKQELFSAYSRLDNNSLDRLCRNLKSELREAQTLTEPDRWVLSLIDNYRQGDVGLICFYFLHLLQIEAGEGVYIGQNIPHAYLEGEMIECMASSDNVVRLGLTPKFRDTETLLSMLRYDAVAPHILSQVPGNNHETHFPVPANEFSLSIIASDQDKVISLDSSLMILFSESGEGELYVDREIFSFAPGSAFFVPHGARNVSLNLTSGRLVRVTVPSASGP
jgi:mannose-6-phosphate isomerase